QVYLFGTFGDGIILVKNLYAQKVPIGNSETKISALTIGDQAIFLASAKGEIYRYDGQKSQLIDSTSMRLSKLFYFPSVQFSINPTYPGLLMQKELDLPGTYYGYGTIKDAFQSQKGRVYIAGTILGLKSDTSPDTTVWNLSAPRLNLYSTKIKALAARFKSIGQVADTQEILLSNPNGTLRYDGKSKVEPLFYQGQRFQVNSMNGLGDSLLLGTEKHGVLCYDDQGLHAFLNEQNGLLADQVFQVSTSPDYLLIRGAKGIQLYPFDQGGPILVGEPEGLPVDRSADVVIFGQHLYTTSKGDLMCVDLASLAPKVEGAPTIYVDSIVVNNKRVQKRHELAANENQLAIHYDFRNLKYKKEAQVAYRMTGLDDEWQQLKETSGVLKFPYLPSGTYQLSLATSVRGQQRVPFRYDFVIQSPFYFQFWFIGAVLLGITGIAVATVRFYLRRIEKKNSIALEREHLLAALNQSKLMAIRSQMNPHFIFNALNSIQDLVLKKETFKAYDYLTEFSNLVRSTLKYSNEDFITMEKEVQFLELYLTLETLRFKNHLTYRIFNEVAPTTKIPPLMIQPFVENAIQHGLLHQLGRKELMIHFFDRDGEVCCEITDNGIGRTQAKRIKKRQDLTHESFS
ncbi:MAG: histidine kinase, partial [Bacteroidota bacterium]